MTRRKAGDKPKPRAVCQLKHPRYYDRKYGLTQVEALFENLTPEGWEAPLPPPEEDQ